MAPNRFELVPFEDRQILTVQQGEEVSVVMRPVVEAMGLAWQGQLERIKRHPVLSEGVSVTRIPSAGGMQEAVALGLEQFHGWLVTLVSDRIRDPARRELVIAYQRRAFRVIFDHFHGQRRQAETPALPIASRIAMQNQILKLTQTLQRLRNPAERQAAHGMLDGLCREIGIATPALNDLGQDAAIPPDIIRPFWDAVVALEAGGIAINHARDPNLFAINLPELREHFDAQKIDMPIGTALRRALALPEARPRLVKRATVNSRHGVFLHCYIFHNEGILRGEGTLLDVA